MSSGRPASLISRFGTMLSDASRAGGGLAAGEIVSLHERRRPHRPVALLGQRRQHHAGHLMHAARRAGDQPAHGGRRWRRRLLGGARRRQIEAEAIDQPAHARLAQLCGAPLDRLVERAGESDDRAPAAAVSPLPLSQPSSPPCAGRGPVEIERVGPVAWRIGDADGGQDLARGGDHAAFAHGVVIARRGAARRRRAEVGGRLAGLEIAHDLAAGVGGHDDHVGHPGARHWRATLAGSSV